MLTCADESWSQFAKFNKEYDKKHTFPETSAASMRHMWATLAALGHCSGFDNSAVLMKAIGIDGGPRACQLAGLMGCAFLTCLDFIERMGWLKPDSEILDLGLVM